MNPPEAIPPPVSLTRTQRLVQHLPLIRKAFWVPTACFGDVRSLAAFASQGSDPGKITFNEVAAPPGDAAIGDPSHEPLFVAQFTPGKVVGDCLLVASDDNVVAGNIQGLYSVERPGEHWVLRRCRYRPTVRLPGTSALLAAAAGGNYYHWLFESLPRLLLLEQAGFAFSQIDHLFVNERPLPFHAETLRFLNVPAEKVARGLKNRVFRCDRLVVPASPAAPKVFPSWALTFLRRRFLPLAKQAAAGRIFISRRQALRRRLVNEAELETLLQGAGFKTVILENQSFAEQVGVFASASAIVAPHGAGLSNLVFAPPGTKVIELVAPTFINHCYQNLAGAMRFPYVEIAGELAGKPRKRSEEDDFVVPLPKLRDALDRLALRTARQ